MDRRLVAFLKSFGEPAYAPEPLGRWQQILQRIPSSPGKGLTATPRPPVPSPVPRAEKPDKANLSADPPRASLNEPPAAQSPPAPSSAPSIAPSPQTSSPIELDEGNVTWTGVFTG